MKRLVCCYWIFPPLAHSRFLLLHSKLTIFSSPLFHNLSYCFQFHPQGLAGYPGAKGDEGPKGEDVSQMMDYMKPCKIMTYLQLHS